MENIFDYLELNAIETCVLKDIKRVLYKFYQSISDIENNDLAPISLLSSHTIENNFNRFFWGLGSKKSKELINLFGKIKVNLGNNVFENEVLIFNLCIDDVNFFKLLYLLDRDNFDDWPILIHQKFIEIKKNLKLRLNNYSLHNL